MLQLVDKQLEKLTCDQTQVFFSRGDWQLYHLLEWILQQTGCVNAFISSYSVSEEFTRQLIRFKQSNLIESLGMVIDYRAARKALNLTLFTSKVADEVRLGNNHSKIMLLSNNDWKITVVTSQNQTRGNRYEAGMISTNPAHYEKLSDEILSIKYECTNGSELLRRIASEG